MNFIFSGFQANQTVNVTEEDYIGPVPSTPTNEPDYLLMISWIFVILCSTCMFVKSTKGQQWINKVRILWQEHQHIDWTPENCDLIKTFLESLNSQTTVVSAVGTIGAVVGNVLLFSRLESLWIITVTNYKIHCNFCVTEWKKNMDPNVVLIRKAS